MKLGSFESRHLGPRDDEVQQMLDVVGVKSLDELMEQTIPASIRRVQDLKLDDAISEHELMTEMTAFAKQNQVFKSYIGQGYHPCIIPPVIRRNILENPAWYTSYTPYQAEIAQGRLEALLNFQTMVQDMTGMEIANASLLDEGTAAAEAMSTAFRIRNRSSRQGQAREFLVSDQCFPQTLAILENYAQTLGFELKICEISNMKPTDQTFGLLVQLPDAEGLVSDYSELFEQVKAVKGLVIVAADLLSLALIKPPGEMGADIVVGTTQRFGVPMGYGGPHAAYFATHQSHARDIPGRIIGVSKDRLGNLAYRMALQTREQHIKRERATSNVCTAQALLANIAGAYAVYHGAEGILNIAKTIHQKAANLAKSLTSKSYRLKHQHYFDTIVVQTSSKAETEKIAQKAIQEQVNFHYLTDDFIGISLNETTSHADLETLASIFETNLVACSSEEESTIPEPLRRHSTFLTHQVFHKYHSETEMMRYLKRLESKDLSLVHAMIPLGSCTMKLNSAASMTAITWEEFANMHPFCPKDQAAGYQQILERLEKDLSEITEFEATSLQPNSGAQGELTGLRMIRAYHHSRQDQQRHAILIPSSAHGTNPASCTVAGMTPVMISCDIYGNIDLEVLKQKLEKYSGQVAGLMITYPSTHGVFEESVTDVCELVHQAGGLVYMDGANMNAQVGLTSPARIGADVCHLNLHKTFGIPHGGGGPGVGPVCCNEKLAPFLPNHPLIKVQEQDNPPASSAPWGSALACLISYAYIRMLGKEGLIQSTKYAILGANYLKRRLAPYYPILYSGHNGRVAHEMILDTRGFKKAAGMTAEDIAKRLLDYGFHAPTQSFPVPETLMIEPTESESKAELDRFCEAFISIRRELSEVERGVMDKTDNPLKNAPHTLQEVCASEWNHQYSREVAAYPVASLHAHKFWPSVSKIDGAYGDRHLYCSCPDIDHS